MFQSRRFWFSYRLRVDGDAAEEEAIGEVIIIAVIVLVFELFGLLMPMLEMLVLSVLSESTSWVESIKLFQFKNHFSLCLMQEIKEKTEI